MNFIESLRQASPSREACLAVGMGTTELLEFLESYAATPRKTSLQLADETNDPLLRLMAGWDFGKIVVGLLCFASKPVKDQFGNWILGEVEADDLRLTQSGEIRVFEMGGEHPMWPVAADSKGLMAALPLAARFLGQCCVNQVDFEDYEAAQKVARECAHAAGGRRYLAFFFMLLGAFP